MAKRQHDDKRSNDGVTFFGQTLDISHINDCMILYVHTYIHIRIVYVYMYTYIYIYTYTPFSHSLVLVMQHSYDIMSITMMKFQITYQCAMFK